ncbi:DUF6441 family protein [Sandarakinorhabdus sp.]|uniref:DUF6441 family protein n=1 Tax=Sandarakinorhabdus sp. TaxID=1916663 RepID=UPI0035688C5A
MKLLAPMAERAMMFRVEGKFADQIAAVELRVAAALRAAVTRTALSAQSNFRRQARAAGFVTGGRAIANAWRMESYPASGRGLRTWRPAAMVWSKVPFLVDLFDKGAVIQGPMGKYLAVPTAINRRPGRRFAGGIKPVRVSAKEMVSSRRAFVLPVKGNSSMALWCLRLEARTSKAGRITLLAASARILTSRAKGGLEQRRAIAKQGFAPMFILLKRVTLRKRLDFAAVAKEARARLLSTVRQELAR